MNSINKSKRPNPFMRCYPSMLLLLPLYSETAITGNTVVKNADKKRSQSKLTNASSPKAAASLVPQSMPAAASRAFFTLCAYCGNYGHYGDEHYYN